MNYIDKPGFRAPLKDKAVIWFHISIDSIIKNWNSTLIII